MDRRSQRLDPGPFFPATLVGISGVVCIYLAVRFDEIPASFPVRWRGNSYVPAAYAVKGWSTVFGGLLLAALAVVVMHVLLVTVHRWSRKQAASSPARDEFETVARQATRRWTAYLEILVVALSILLGVSPLSPKAPVIWKLHILLLCLGSMVPILPLIRRLSRAAPPAMEHVNTNRWLVYWAPTDPRLAAPGGGTRPVFNVGNLWNVVVLGFPMVVVLACSLGYALRDP